MINDRMSATEFEEACSNHPVMQSIMSFRYPDLRRFRIVKKKHLQLAGRDFEVFRNGPIPASVAQFKFRRPKFYEDVKEDMTIETLHSMEDGIPGWGDPTYHKRGNDDLIYVGCPPNDKLPWLVFAMSQTALDQAYLENIKRWEERYIMSFNERRFKSYTTISAVVPWNELALHLPIQLGKLYANSDDEIDIPF